MLFQAPNDDTDEEVWLGRTAKVDGQPWEGRCWSQTGAREDVDGVRFDQGDIKVAVKWYEYSVEDDEYEWWESDKPYHIMNATALCFARLSMVQGQGGIPALAVRPRRGPHAGAEQRRDRSRRWKLDAEDKAKAVQECGGVKRQQQSL